MAYEDYMVQEDLDLERSMRDTRLAPAGGGVSQVNAMAASSMFGGMPVNGFKVQELLQRSAEFNRQSRGIRKEYSEEQEKIADRDAFSELTGVIKSSGASGSDQTKVIQSWIEDNPGKAMSEPVQDFRRSSSLSSGMTRDKLQIEAQERGLEFVADNKDTFNKIQTLELQTQLRAAEALNKDTITGDAQADLNLINETGMQISSMDLDKDQQSAVFGVLREYSSDPEKAPLLQGLVSGIGAMKSLSLGNSVYREEINTLGRKARIALTQSVQLPKIAEDGTVVLDEEGNPVMENFAPHEVPPEGQEALEAFFEKQAIDFADPIAFGNYKEVVEEWRQLKHYETESKQGFKELIGDMTSLKQRAAEGDVKAKEELENRLYGFSFNVSNFKGKIQDLSNAQQRMLEKRMQNHDLMTSQAKLQKILTDTRNSGGRLAVAQGNLALRRWAYDARRSDKARSTVIKTAMDSLVASYEGGAIPAKAMENFQKELMQINADFDAGLPEIPDTDRFLDGVDSIPGQVEAF